MRLIEQVDHQSDHQSAPWLSAARLYKWLPGGKATAAPEESAGFEDLAETIADLRKLNESTERYFLDIGAKLTAFFKAAQTISSGLNELTVLISGAQGKHASEVLNSALDRCRQMESRALERGRHLETLRGGSRSIRSTFAAFREFLATFRVLCNLTRIESARLAAAGTDFGSVSEDVKSLAEHMGSKVENILEAALQLDQRVEDTVVSLSDADSLIEDLSSIVPAVMSSLRSFSDGQLGAAALSAQLATDSRSVSSSISGAVTSIQFHDITRQQIEHVIDALRNVYSTRGKHARLSKEATVVLILQSSQLADADQKFVSSASRLLQDLDNITACVRDMTRNGSDLLNPSEEGGASFFAKMERCLTTILKAAGGDQTAELATLAAARDLAVTLGSMQNANGEIRAIDLQLFRVAINASIRAAHSGSLGETLGVLASAMQDLSTCSGDRSDVVGTALDSMSAAVAQLSNVDAHEKFIAAETRSTIAELHAWSETSVGRIRETALLASRLCDDIAAAQAAFDIGEHFTRVIARSRAALARMTSKAGPGTIDTAALDLNEFASRYTMQAERDVHKAITRQSSSVPLPPGPAAPQHQASEDFGGNVELF